MPDYKEIIEKLEFDAAMILVDEGYTDETAGEIDEETRLRAMQKTFDKLPKNEQLLYTINSRQFIEYMKEKYPLESILEKYTKNGVII